MKDLKSFLKEHFIICKVPSYKDSLLDINLERIMSVLKEKDFKNLEIDVVSTDNDTKLIRLEKNGSLLSIEVDEEGFNYFAIDFNNRRFFNNFDKIDEKSIEDLQIISDNLFYE